MVMTIFTDTAFVTLFVDGKARTIFFQALGLFACTVYKVILLLLHFSALRFFNRFDMIILSFLFRNTVFFLFILKRKRVNLVFKGDFFLSNTTKTAKSDRT
jgi:hypothetical protein